MLLPLICGTTLSHLLKQVRITERFGLLVIPHWYSFYLPVVRNSTHWIHEDGIGFIEEAHSLIPPSFASIGVVM